MKMPQVGDVVRLNQDIKELGLHCGDIGTVQSSWFGPTTAYEVKFVGERETSALLLAEQISLVEDEAVPAVW